MFKIRLLTLGLLAAFSVGCALPRPPQRSDFVAEQDLLTVRLAREAATFFQQSRFIEAELRYRQVLHISPEAQNMKRNLALTLVRLGNFEEARKIYQSLLALKPEETELQLALAGLSYEQGDFKTSQAYYKQALEIEIKNLHFDRAAGIQRSLAVLNFKIGNEQEALCYSAQALMLAPDFPQSVRHARLLLGVGQYKAASDQMQKLPLDAAERISLDFVAITSIADYALGADKQAYERTDQFLRLQGENAGSEPALRLVHYFVQNQKQREAMDPDRQAEVQSILKSDFLSQPLALYLPYRLLKQIAEAAASLEAL